MFLSIYSWYVLLFRFFVYYTQLFNGDRSGSVSFCSGCMQNRKYVPHSDIVQNKIPPRHGFPDNSRVKTIRIQQQHPLPTPFVSGESGAEKLMWLRLCKKLCKTASKAGQRIRIRIHIPSGNRIRGEKLKNNRKNAKKLGLLEEYI